MAAAAQAAAAEAQRRIRDTLQTDAVKTAVKIQQFYGDETLDASINEFIQRFESATTTMGLDTDEQRAKYFGSYLRGCAYQLYTNLGAFGIEANDWQGIKAFFLKKYKGELSAHSAVITFDTLRQEKGESVIQFFARVQTQIRLYMDLSAGVPDTEYSAEIQAATAESRSGIKKANKKLYTNMMVRTFFIGGIKESLRTDLQRLAPLDFNLTLDEALKLEQTEIKDKPIRVAELADLDDDELAKMDLNDEVVEKINSHRAKKGYQPFRRFNGGNRRGNESSNSLKCRYCDQLGHLQKTCFTRINKGDPQIDEKGRPYKNAPRNNGKGVRKGVSKISEDIISNMGNMFNDNHLNWQ
jgi:hypothetical protein